MPLHPAGWEWTTVIGWCWHKTAGEKGVVFCLLLMCVNASVFLNLGRWTQIFFIANSKTEPLFAIIRFVSTEKYCLMILGFSERVSVNCRDSSHFLFHDSGSQWLTAQCLQHGYSDPSYFSWLKWPGDHHIRHPHCWSQEALRGFPNVWGLRVVPLLSWSNWVRASSHAWDQALLH